MEYELKAVISHWGDVNIGHYKSFQPGRKGGDLEKGRNVLPQKHG